MFFLIVTIVSLGLSRLPDSLVLCTMDTAYYSNNIITCILVPVFFDVLEG